MKKEIFGKAQQIFGKRNSERKEDLLKMWKEFSVNMVRQRGANHVARTCEHPWQRVAGEVELLEMVRDYSRTVREAVAPGNVEAEPLAKRQLVFGQQETGLACCAGEAPRTTRRRWEPQTGG